MQTSFIRFGGLYDTLPDALSGSSRNGHGRAEILSQIISNEVAEKRRREIEEAQKNGLEPPPPRQLPGFTRFNAFA